MRLPVDLPRWYERFLVWSFRVVGFIFVLGGSCALVFNVMMATGLYEARVPRRDLLIGSGMAILVVVIGMIAMTVRGKREHH